MSSPVPDVVRVLTTSHCYLPGERCRVKRDSHVTWKMVTLMSRLTMSMAIEFSPLAATNFPTGGHLFSPLVATNLPTNRSTRFWCVR